MLPNEVILEIYIFIPYEQVLRDTIHCFPILKKIHKTLYSEWADKHSSLYICIFLAEYSTGGFTKSSIDELVDEYDRFNQLKRSTQSFFYQHLFYQV